MRPTEYIVVWCDSPLGLISHRVRENDTLITYLENEIPPTIPIITSAREAFRLLNFKNGDKVAVPYESVEHWFGWEVV
jgi:hypothetical protein